MDRLLSLDPYLRNDELSAQLDESIYISCYIFAHLLVL